MARRNKHPEHQNHEAWAIPYGDLVTLLLAFFVVMYAISSVNEGKYRVLADALSEAFGGPARTIEPIQIGDFQPRTQQRDAGPPMSRSGARGPISPTSIPGLQGRSLSSQDVDRAALARADAQLEDISRAVETALAELIAEDLVTIRRSQFWVEIEIKSDILFASGVAVPQTSALPTLEKLATALSPFPNPLRIEGHTDNVPISTRQFPSNWELSSARAASVVHVFQRYGIAPDRLAVIGYGEFRPRGDNHSAEGRNTNRRVVLVILSTVGGNNRSESNAGERKENEKSAAIAVPPVNPSSASPAATP